MDFCLRCIITDGCDEDASPEYAAQNCAAKLTSHSLSIHMEWSHFATDPRPHAYRGNGWKQSYNTGTTCKVPIDIVDKRCRNGSVISNLSTL